MMRLLQCLISISVVVFEFTTTFSRDQQQPFLRRSNINSNENQHLNIESREVEPGLFSIYVAPPADNNDAERRRLRPATEEYQYCILYLEDVYYYAADSKNVEEKWVCTIENYVSEYGIVPSPFAFYLSGDFEKTEQFLKTGVVSGHHILRWDSAEAVILNEINNTLTLNANLSEDRNVLWIETIDANKPVVFEEGDEDEETNERKLQFRASTKGVKKTLVIRIVGDGVGPAPSLVEIREEIFGSDLSLKSQMEKCSHGELVIQPFTGVTRGHFKQKILGGVVQLGLSVNPYGKDDKRMENEVMSAAWYVFGDLYSQFDLVLFAMPPGIVPEFAAYAYVGMPFSYYSDDAIRDTMIQMHEIGHNLGLQHSGEGDIEYGDSSGYMGYTENTDPSMCYNAVNNYQLDWYSKLSIRPTSVDGYGGTFIISGVAGYDSSDTTKVVTLRLVQENLSTDYYVGYNRADGINADTQEDGDKVIVFTKGGDVHESIISWKKAALHIGESYHIENFDNSGKSVTVTFSNIDSNAAIVEVTLERSESPTLSPRPSIAPTASTAPTTLVTATSSFLSTTATTSVTSFSGTTPGTPPVTTNGTAPGTICNDELFLNIDIRTDYFPKETWWKLKSIGGKEIGQVMPSTYDIEFANYTHSYCLDYDTCYLFKIFDTAQDGMGFVGETTASPGHYKVYLGSELQFGKEGEWGKKKITKFCTPPDPLLNLGNETDFEGKETDTNIDFFDVNGNKTDSTP